MQTVTRRVVLPALLAVGGIVSLLYGAFLHRQPVLGKEVVERVVQEEHEETIQPASPFGPESMPQPGGIPSADGGFPGPPAPFFPGPPPMKVKRIVDVKKKTLEDVVQELPEAELVREISVGGVTLADGGLLRRTWAPSLTGGDRPPSLCPT